MSIVSFLQATNPGMATELTNERLATTRIIVDLQAEVDALKRALAKSIEEGLSYLESVFHERGGVDDKLSDWEKEFRDEIEKARAEV